jgi:hypothetical protein
MERALDLPLRRELVGAAPDAAREPREIRCAECRRLDALRPHDGDAEQVGLELHQQVVDTRAAVDAQLGDR